jgi:hypothetical protein
MDEALDLGGPYEPLHTIALRHKPAVPHGATQPVKLDLITIGCFLK